MTLYIQRNPDYYAAAWTRENDVAAVFDGKGKVEKISGSVSNLYLTRSPILNLSRDVFQVLDKRHFYAVPYKSSIRLSPDLENLPIKKCPGVKTVRIFSDITLIHNTRSMNITDSFGMMRDNPMLALSRMYGRIFELIDGKQRLGDIYRQISREFGMLLKLSEFLAFLLELQQLSFIGQLDNRLPAKAAVDNRQRPWDLNIAYVQNQLKYTEAPLYTLLELTYDCNLACRTCYVKTFIKDKQPSAEDYIDNILSKIIASGVSYVSLLGGEPLIYKDLLIKSVRELRQADIYAKLITNGTLLDDAVVNELADAGLNKVELSLDGLEPHTNDYCRGKGTFDKILRSIDLLLDANTLQTGLSITVHGGNFNEIINGLPLFVSRHGIRQVYFSRYFNCRRSKMEELTPEQEILLSEKCEEWNSGCGQEYPNFEAVILGKTCTCGRSSVVVTPRGELKACPFVDYRETRISEDRSLIDIWKNSEQFWQIRERPRSSCAARNLRDNGKIEGSDKQISF